MHQSHMSTVVGAAYRDDGSTDEQKRNPGAKVHGHDEIPPCVCVLGVGDAQELLRRQIHDCVRRNVKAVRVIPPKHSVGLDVRAVGAHERHILERAIGARNACHKLGRLRDGVDVHGLEGHPEHERGPDGDHRPHVEGLVQRTSEGVCSWDLHDQGHWFDGSKCDVDDKDWQRNRRFPQQRSLQNQGFGRHGQNVRERWIHHMRPERGRVLR
ncbi:hypothetical protein H257_13165 [Aphanomyces astaci]|uniref:Uncharacterized protein n=1 Tax=Aphanomyces astaci TaxID=112090 RepID=W4FY78_APHAT|nr:hypothetical protein H257_13165 [Aphanomyces astaci]ETV71744.1 hypothetical protein H257_13165 [Aphanomyces astaci]|eukprot:XP_009838932.1 hypothetical protein H257_13165 [Aphanomyces astaci]